LPHKVYLCCLFGFDRMKEEVLEGTSGNPSLILHVTDAEAKYTSLFLDDKIVSYQNQTRKGKERNLA